MELIVIIQKNNPTKNDYGLIRMQLTGKHLNNCDHLTFSLIEFYDHLNILTNNI